MKSNVDNGVDALDFSDLGRMEELWAKELYETNANDREVINDEVHGVPVSSMDTNREQNWTEQHYCLYLRMFEIELETKIPLESKQTYQMGIDLGSSYIQSREFRFRFIRAERYDISKAVHRYCNCLDFLLEFFGEVALLRPLPLRDLTKNEMKFLKEGYIQVLPSRDRLGRRILAQVGSYGGTRYSEIEKFRVCVYLCFSVLSEDITTQRLGVVSLGSFTLEAEVFMRKGLREISKLIKRFFRIVPLRWSATHLCIPDDPVFHLIKSLSLFFLGIQGRRMLRIHIGTPMECDYKLRCFGLPTDDIPRTSTHKIKLKNHARLIEVRRTIDEFRLKTQGTNPSTHVQLPGVECPEINCVLFGKFAYSYQGNIEYRGLIPEIEEEHSGYGNPDAKLFSVTQRLIEESLRQKFRFMMYDRNTFLYTEVTDYDTQWGLVQRSVKEYRKRSKTRIMIHETKLSILTKSGKNGNKNISDGNVSSLGVVTTGGDRCVDCKCLVGK
mmetsp:Transcript_24238/g.67133  ORF Transcript_24238/g.67133 Transcript_24238/m.67133 type:complete len:498 (+) Transcript_24238:161-1654(+)